jgi:hypothetical protein
MTEDPRHEQDVERDEEDRERFAMEREEREAEASEKELERKLERADKEGAEARKLVDQEVAHERGTDHQHPPPDAPP